MSILVLSCADGEVLLRPKLRPRVRDVKLAVREGRLQIELAGVDTQLPLIGLVDLGISLTAVAVGPGRVEMDLRVERALGPLAVVIRPLMKQILQVVIPADYRAAIVVETPRRMLVNLDLLEIEGKPVSGLVRLTGFIMPSREDVLCAEFSCV